VDPREGERGKGREHGGHGEVGIQQQRYRKGNEDEDEDEDDEHGWIHSHL